MQHSWSVVSLASASVARGPELIRPSTDLNMAAGLAGKPDDRKFLNFTLEKEGKWLGPFCFVQGADTQFGLKDNWGKETPEEEQSWEDELELTRQAIEGVNNLRPKPKFFIVCGDMVDAFPWKKNYDAQFKDFQSVFQDLDPEIPLLCVCGNHDVGDSPTAETISTYKSNYGDDYYSFWVGGKRGSVELQL